MNNFWTDVQSELLLYSEEAARLMPRLLVSILLFTIMFFLANRSRRYLHRRLSARMDDPLLAKFIAQLVRSTWIIIALLLVLKIIGLTDIAAGLITGASVSAIVVGFAFKDIGENLLAGIMLAFNRPFKIGDLVELNGHQGIVTALSLRNSQIKSFDGRDIYIPNANVIKNPVINYTIDGFQRFDYRILLDIDADARRAVEIASEAMASIPGVLTEQKSPAAFITTNGKNQLELSAFFWVNTFDKSVSAGQARTAAIEETVKLLRSAGFYLPLEIVELKNYHDHPLSSQTGNLSGQ